jgi:hypothetical protein
MYVDTQVLQPGMLHPTHMAYTTAGNQVLQLGALETRMPPSPAPPLTRMHLVTRSRSWVSYSHPHTHTCTIQDTQVLRLGMLHLTPPPTLPPHPPKPPPLGPPPPPTHHHPPAPTPLPPLARTWYSMMSS